MTEEPEEEPIPEEEIPEEPPSIEEVEEVAPPRGIAAFKSWTFKTFGVTNLSQKLSKSNTHQYAFLYHIHDKVKINYSWHLNLCVLFLP